VILITGATGQVEREAVNTLVAAGTPVRALVRNRLANQAIHFMSSLSTPLRREDAHPHGSAPSAKGRDLTHARHNDNFLDRLIAAQRRG
jgi:uncharacterized protein YbjT (DUF2867 family)